MRTLRPEFDAMLSNITLTSRWLIIPPLLWWASPLWCKSLRVMYRNVHSWYTASGWSSFYQQFSSKHDSINEVLYFGLTFHLLFCENVIMGIYYESSPVWVSVIWASNFYPHPILCYRVCYGMLFYCLMGTHFLAGDGNCHLDYLKVNSETLDSNYETHAWQRNRCLPL